ncbi:MAG: TraB/GumN family protein [Victivallales bacterium]
MEFRPEGLAFFWPLITLSARCPGSMRSGLLADIMIINPKFLPANVKVISVRLLIAVMLSFLGTGCDESKYGTCSGSLLWKLEYDGRTSWIFGTMHAPNPAFSRIPEPVKKALAESKVFFSEIEPNEKNQVKIMQGMLLPETESLEAKIGKSKFTRLKNIIEKFNPPISSSFINRNKIWAASLLIAWPRQSTDPVPMDVFLYEKAKIDGCETIGLETPEEQLAPLDNFTETEQIQLLTEAIDEAENGYKMLNGLLQKYISQDLSGIAEEFYSRKTSFTPQFRDKFIEKLLKKRNDLFLERLLPTIKEKDCFVAVGAGHLIGSHGLIAQLEKAGFKATPVEFNFDVPIQNQLPKFFYLFHL